MSGVVDVLFYPWCGGCLVWWMSGVVDVCVVDVVQSTISLCCISPEILASFPGQYIYVISADILALFHRPAESTALPVIFRAGCSPTVEEKGCSLTVEEEKNGCSPTGKDANNPTPK